MEFYHVNLRDEIRRAYLQKGPLQPEKHTFPQRDFGGKLRRFNPSWFDENKYWLEYSIIKDAAFCLCCYLFKSNIPNQGGSDHFVKSGFKAWNRKSGIDLHKVGNPHNIAVQKCQNLMNQRQSITSALDKQTTLQAQEYRTRLNASVDCVRFLLRQGLAFRDHNEKEDSDNKGNFLELLQWLADRCEMVDRVVLRNDPKNTQLKCSDIQKDIVQACSDAFLNFIMEDIGNDFFAILVDESRDVAYKEQLALVLRYVNGKGEVVERFVGLKNVSDTSALSLKATIYDMLSKWNLSNTRIRGQGYDGASNMSGKFNRLKNLIVNETKSAHFVHCFAHQLQLALVFVAKNHTKVNDLFDVVSRLINIIGSSYKRRDNLKKKDIVQACSDTVLNFIMEDLGNDFFAILVDESRDVAYKEQLALVLRYVNGKGEVAERFVGLKNVSDTSALSLKATIYDMLSKWNLSNTRIRGQGYDGASNMSGKFNRLKNLIMNETKSAHFVHCFAHQLQLALVFVAKNHTKVNDLFDVVSWLINIIGSSYKRRDNLKKKDIVQARSDAVLNFIMEDLGNEFFAILVDESRDVAYKEQLALVLRYVNGKGEVLERFVGLKNVSDTSALSLKATIYDMLSKWNLSNTRIRGNVYDGASNMSGKFNRLKTLIMNETKSAHFVHCFAHQLQLALVFVAKNHTKVNDLFDVVSRLINIIGSSYKRRDNLKKKETARVLEALAEGELEIGTGLNQEVCIKRPFDTRWGSHFSSILNIRTIYPSICEVLEDLGKDTSDSDRKAEAIFILKSLKSFDFVFCLHLMVDILGVTNHLNTTLRRKDQDIVNAMNQVNSSKNAIQEIRDIGWDRLLEKVTLFCDKYDVEILDM